MQEGAGSGPTVIEHEGRLVMEREDVGGYGADECQVGEHPGHMKRLQDRARKRQGWA